MPAPGQLLVSALTADAAVHALLAGRIRPNRLEAGAQLPAAVYQLINQQPAGFCLRGGTSTDTARLQLTLYAPTYAALDALAGAVRRALRGSAFEFQSEGDQYDDQGQIGGRRQDYLISISNP